MKLFLKLLFLLLIIWVLLTLYIQYSGKGQTKTISPSDGLQKVLIVYNPDPFYNLDYQIAESIADGLLNYNIGSKIISSKDRTNNLDDFVLVVICANTYNFAPDWGVTNFIKSHQKFENKKVVAITLGSGATKRSATKLMSLLRLQGAHVLFESEYWLSKPNDDKSDEDNVAVAVKMAEELGQKIGQELTKT